jgi:hypothetical protein
LVDLPQSAITRDPSYARTNIKSTECQSFNAGSVGITVNLLAILKEVSARKHIQTGSGLAQRSI